MPTRPLIALCFMLAAAAFARTAKAAELVVFERAGCSWCEAFDREIAPIYPKTASGKLAPLRRVNIYGPMPADLSFLKMERLTPVFVLVDKGKELGRIRGYPGEDYFWGLLDAMVERHLTPNRNLHAPSQ